MARKRRLHVPGGLYHIVLHGNPIFLAAEDWEVFETLTARALTVCAARVHAYCWLQKEAHYALQIGHVGTGRVMQRICAPYARYMRRKHGIVSVFQSRYRARLVDRDRHLLALVRHVTRRSLTAGMALDELDQHPGSSHSIYLGRRRSSWLSTDEVWEALSWRGANVELAYQRLIAAPASSEEAALLAEMSKRKPAIANITYLEWMGTRSRRPAASLERIMSAVAARLDVSVELMCSSSREHKPSMARALVALHAYRAGIASVAEVARYFGRDSTAISKAISKAVEHYQKAEPELFGESLAELLNWTREAKGIAPMPPPAPGKSGNRPAGKREE